LLFSVDILVEFARPNLHREESSLRRDNIRIEFARPILRCEIEFARPILRCEIEFARPQNIYPLIAGQCCEICLRYSYNLDLGMLH